MAMESQAEALGQLTTDDLEGKVAISFFFYIPFNFLTLFLYVFVMILPFVSFFQMLMEDD